MTPIFTAAEMRALDQRAISALGLTGAALMENAGRGATDAIVAFLAQHHRRLRGLRAVVVSGKGNNGGDGFVVARLLARRGARVQVFLVGFPAAVRGDAARTLAALGRSRIRPIEITNQSGIARLRAALAKADLAVDALLGTGTAGPPSGLVAEAIAGCAEAQTPVVALDLPSGLATDTGEAPGPVVRAGLTATFAGLKRGLLHGRGPDVAGEVRVVPIGVPPEEVARAAGAFMLEADDVRHELPPRPRDAHKGTYGHVLIVAGSVGKTGAAALAGRAALRMGVGLVTIASPRSQQPVVAGLAAELMTEPLAETDAQTLALAARDRVLELAESCDAVALGPGLGLHPETQGLVRALVRSVPKPMVVDADALTALVGHLDLLAAAPAPRCLTPHPGEMARLLGQSIAHVQTDRIETARRFAERWQAFLVLKGHLSVVASPGERPLLNPTGNPGMASGGTGDVLTGMVGTFLARGVPPLRALACAAYLHGLAGDLAVEGKGPEGLIAGDVIEAIPTATLRIQRA